MRLPLLLVVAKKTNESNINCSLGEGVKFGSVALWEHLSKSLDSDCRLTFSNVLDMIEDLIYVKNRVTQITEMTRRQFARGSVSEMMNQLDFQKYLSAHGGMHEYTAVLRET